MAPFYVYPSPVDQYLVVFYFRQVPLISEIKIVEILEVGVSYVNISRIYLFPQVLCQCLDDEVVEVREKAAT